MRTWVHSAAVKANLRGSFMAIIMPEVNQSEQIYSLNKFLNLIVTNALLDGREDSFKKFEISRLRKKSCRLAFFNLMKFLPSIPVFMCFN